MVLSFCYDIEENAWQRPAQQGDVPPPRYGALTINNDGMVILFGGVEPVQGCQVDQYGYGLVYHDDIRFNDLYSLDMSNLFCERVHVPTCTGMPETRFQNPCRDSFMAALINPSSASPTPPQCCMVLDCTKIKGQKFITTTASSSILREPIAAQSPPQCGRGCEATWPRGITPRSWSRSAEACGRSEALPTCTRRLF